MSRRPLLRGNHAIKIICTQLIYVVVSWFFIYLSQFFTYNVARKKCGLRKFAPGGRSFSVGNLSGLKNESPSEWKKIENSVYVGRKFKTSTQGIAKPLVTLIATAEPWFTINFFNNVPSTMEVVLLGRYLCLLTILWESPPIKSALLRMHEIKLTNP